MKPITELTDEELDYWVAKAQGWELINYGSCWKSEQFTHTITRVSYHPTSNWQQAGELIEKFDCSLEYYNSCNCWGATARSSDMEVADTPQRAICLAVVASKYGEEVEDGSE